MCDVYIIYAAEDSHVARNFHNSLTSVGLDVYIYEDDVQVGSSLRGNYKEIIDKSLVVLSIISEQWLMAKNKNKELHKEVEVSNSLGKKMLPFLIGDVKYDEILRVCKGVAYVSGGTDRRIMKYLELSPYRSSVIGVLDALSREDGFDNAKVDTNSIFGREWKPLVKFTKRKVSAPSLIDLWSLALYVKGIGFSEEADIFRLNINQKLMIRGHGLTSVQKEVYDSHFSGDKLCLDDSCFLSDKHLIISAPTSAGKSLLSECFLVRVALLNTTRNKAIYVAPTRALAQAKYAELMETLENSPRLQDGLILSTGEDKDADRRLSAGAFSVACMVYEKANVVFSRNPRMLESIGVVVIDEVHLIEDLHRGPALEIMLAKLVSERKRLDLNRAQDKSQEKLRIVAITTENSESQALRKLLATDRGDFPIHIRSTKRPLPVLHKIAVSPSTAGKDKVELFEVVKYEDSRDRNISNETVKSLDGLVNSKIRSSVEKRGRETEMIRASNLAHELLLDYLEKFGKGHRILVFLPSKNMVESQAARLKNVLSNKRGNNEYGHLHRDAINLKDFSKYDGFLKCIKESESKNLSKRIYDFAEYGVYIHHSDIDRNIRNSIENICNESVGNEKTEVIFSTTTLAYGVNLSLDVVILNGYIFVSNDRSGDIKYEPLSSSLYFNMVGRAGRFGKTNIDVPEVCTIIPTPSSVLDFLGRYYYSGDRAESEDLESVLFTRNDEVEEDSAISKVLGDIYGKKGVVKDNSFSYPFLWAVLDALRHLNYQERKGRSGEAKYTSIQEIIRFLGENTLYSAAVIKNSLYDFATSISGALNQCHQHGLVTKPPTNGDNETLEKYRITIRGEAILDTSTHVVTLTSLSKIAAKIDKLYQEAFPDKSYTPAEIHLVGLMLQEEVYKDVYNYTPECANNRGSNWNPMNEDFNKSNIESIFRGNIESVIKDLYGCFVDQTRLDKFLDRLIHLIASYNLSFSGHYSGSSIHAIMRIYNCLFDWIAGKEYQHVLSNVESFFPLSGAANSVDVPGMGSTSWSGFRSFIEKVHYKVRFMARILSLPGDDGTISIEAQRCLFMLVERVRLGCQEDAIPLFYPKQSKLVRSEAAYLVKTFGIPADLMLTSSSLINSIPNESIENKKLLHLDCDLRKFAVEKFQDLESELTLRGGESKRLEIYSSLFREMSVNYIGRAIDDYLNDDLVSDGRLGNIIMRSLDLGAVDSEVTDDGRRRTNLFMSRSARDSDVRLLSVLNSNLQDRLLWIAQKKSDGMDNEDDFDAVVEENYHIIPIDMNQKWECCKAQSSGLMPLLDVVRSEKAVHSIYVVGPWLPNLHNCPAELLNFFKSTSTDRTVVFMSVSVFCSLMMLAERRFIRDVDVLNILEGNGVLESSVFPYITINHIAELFADNKEVPPAIMEVFVNHYEANSLRIGGLSDLDLLEGIPKVEALSYTSAEAAPV